MAFGGPTFRLSLPNGLTLAVLVALAIAFFRPPGDLDYCWQIRTGERILATGQLRQPEPFSYTISGKDLPDHEWLYEATLAVVWQTLGDPGLKLVRMLLFATPILLLVWQLSQRRVPAYAIALSAIAVTLILTSFERLRPLVCSTIGLQLVAGWLYDHVRSRRSLDWKLPLVMLLWANLHPAVIMGQALILGAIGWEWLAQFRNRQSPVANLRSLTLWGGLGLAATLFSPAPLDRLLYPFASELRHPAQRFFVEIRPPWHFLDVYAVWLALLLATVFTTVLILRRRQFAVWEWALLVGVGGLALMAIRGLGDWLMITAALAVPQIGPLLRHAAKSKYRFVRPILYLDRLGKRLFSGQLLRPQPAWLVGCFATISALAFLPWGDHLPNREAADWPTEAVDWIAKGHLPGPGPWNIFSGSNEGTYLFWRLRGKARVYTDTRGFYYPGELLDDSFNLPRGDDAWRERLQRTLKNGSAYFLLPAGDGLWPKLKPHVAQPLYADSNYVILSADQVRDAAGKVDGQFPCSTQPPANSGTSN